MIITKSFTTLIRQSLLISLLFLVTCQYYKTYQIETSYESLTTVAKYKPNIIIHGRDGFSSFLLTNWTFENDSLSGVLSMPILVNHEPFDKSFRRHSAKGEEPTSTMHLYTSLADMKPGKISFPLSMITTGAEIHEKNVSKSVFATTSLIVGTGLLALVVGVGIACACPQVESNNAQSSKFHGSLFPGAIFKSLKREDYLILDNVLVDEGNINLKIFNNLPETEYIDHLQVLEVAHNGYEYLGVDIENKFVGYNQAETSTLSLAGNLNNITSTLSYRDNLIYNFDNLDSPDELNSITLKYDKNKLSGDTKLIIRGKQTQWLETVANYIFLNIGKSYDNWVKRKDRAPAKKWHEKNEWQGVALNVYLKVNDEWEYVGSHHDGGTLSMRELVMDIDLNQVTGSSFEIKLESAYKIWELDYVGITNDWNEDLTVNTLDIQSIVDEDGRDISNSVAVDDSNYHIQEGEGSYINLIAKGPSMETSSIVLQGAGYYHHIREYEHKANLKFFMKLNDKLGVQDLSKALDLYNDLNVVASNSK